MCFKTIFEPQKSEATEINFFQPLGALHMIRRFSSLVYICFLLTSPGLAQKTYRFEDISIAQGLSQSGVISMAQDVPGYLWVGTQDGLNKYDGHSFRVYRNKKGDPHSIVRNYVTKVFVDSQERIWVASLGHLSLYNPVTDGFSNFPIRMEGYVTNPDVYVWDLAEDEGMLVLSTDDGLIHFNPSQSQFYIDSPFVKLHGITVLGYYKTQSNGRWVISNAMVIHQPDGSTNWQHAGEGAIRSYYLPNEDRVYIYKAISTGYGNIFTWNQGQWEMAKLIDNGLYSILSVYRLSNGEKWVSTDNGITIFDKANQKVETITPFEISSGTGNYVTTIYQTREGIIWLGTNGYGLKKYNPQINQFNYIGTSQYLPVRLSHNYIDAIFTPNDTLLYVATPDGLDVLNLHDKSSEHFILPERITHITTDETGAIWLLNNHAIWLFKNNRFLSIDFSKEHKPPVYPLFRRGLIGASKINLIDYGKSETLLDKSLGDITVIQLFGDTLWVGMGPGAAAPIKQYRFSTKEFLGEFRSNPADPQTIRGGGGIKCIERDSKGRIWIGTNGNGMSLYHPVTNTFTHYTEENGLPNNVVYGILEDDLHNLWLSTNKGLCEFTPETLEVRKFEAFDGLQSNEFNTRAYFKSQSGLMYFGGVNGISYFDPSIIEVQSTASKAIITGFYVNGKFLPDYSNYVKTIDNQPHLFLESTERDFGFDFVSIGFSLPSRTRYRYMLENYNDQWIDLENLRHINFTNIPPGAYTFKVKASDAYGNWDSQEASLVVFIDSPIWRKPAVWLFSALSGVIMLLMFYYGRITSLNKRAMHLEQLVADRTLEIQHQNAAIAHKNNTLLQQASVLEEKNQELEKAKGLLELEVKYFHQHQLLKTSVETQEEERKRISSDLHDELGAVLSIARMHIVRLRELHAKGVTDLQPSLQEVYTLTEAALSTMRRISHELMPPLLEKFGLIKSLEAVVRQINDAKKISITLSTPDPSMRWPLSVEIGLYRICMELITNTLKHANASHIHLQVSQDNDIVSVRYSDDGVGLKDIIPTGRGFSNIEMRVSILGGSFEIDQKSKIGFHARIIVPTGTPLDL
jgi:signal transduction histidine kinase/ligand-binding sensor domain-containing protein